jgi:MFS family permease
MESTTNLKFNILVFICIYFFISGADGYIIVPTAWYYIRSLGFSKSFYGAVLAAQPFGYILFSPVVGKLADKTRRIKSILLVCVMLKVTANLVYAIPVSGYCPLVGYFFSGIANAAYGVMYGEIVRYTKNEHRSKLFILVDAAFTVGASCGPVFGALITFKTNILGWNVDSGNSPAIILAMVWSMIFCVLIFLPSDFGTREIPNKIELHGTIDGTDNNKPGSLKKSLNSTTWCLFYLILPNSLIAAVSAGTISLLAMELFHLKLIHVKLLFGAGMTFVLLACLSAYIATTRYSERSILGFTMILQIPSMLLFCAYAFLWTSAPFSLSYTLVVFLCFGMPQIVFAFVGSLLSKITPSQHASTVQSFAIAVVYIAALVGRGMSGLVFSQMRLIGFSVALILLWLVGFTWFGFVFHRLPRR